MLLADSVRRELRECGFSVFRQIAHNDATAMAHALGEVLRVSEVRLLTGVNTYLARPAPIPLHTDHPAVRYIVWFCLANQASGGENVLLDGYTAIEQLSAGQRRNLAKAHLRCPEIAGRDPVSRHPVWNEASRSLFFAPWLPRSQEHAQVLDDFDECLASPTTRRHVVRLDPGDALVLDNRRMLHGRDALEPGSPRWLTRYWIGGEHVACPTSANSLA